MVPYVEIPPLRIFDFIIIRPFGLLVVTGCVTGFLVARWHGISRNLDPQEFIPLITWTLLVGFVTSHLFSLVFYFPEQLFDRPLRWYGIGNAMSSYGGFLGGGLTAVVYLKRKKLPILEYSDSLVLGLTVGWFFGRLGCTLVHDHPGRVTDFFLAVQYPDALRHDLGFYEWLFTIILIGIVLFVRRRDVPTGVIVGVVCVLYAPVRFLLDFLRIADKLYYGLTLAQYFSIALLLFGIGVLYRSTTHQNAKDR